MTARYAVYFVPRPETPLGAFGTRWLECHEGLADRALQRRVTAKPRRYGFHATLKAPFRLAEHRSPDLLSKAIAAFAETRPAPSPLPLTLRPISGFLALVPAEAAPEIEGLAQACVEAFEPFRAPLSEAELARRRAGGLSPRQDALLRRWGYPYVEEEFRFHMTLTDRLTEEERQQVEPPLAAALAPLLERPLEIDALALVCQDAPDLDFMLLKRFPLLP